jgi:hypothetical protein
MHLIQIQTNKHPRLGTFVTTTPIMVLTAEHPDLLPILDRFGLDTCCGSHLTVVEACGEHALDPDAVATALVDRLKPSARVTVITQNVVEPAAHPATFGALSWLDSPYRLLIRTSLALGVGVGFSLGLYLLLASLSGCPCRPALRHSCRSMARSRHLASWRCLSWLWASSSSRGFTPVDSTVRPGSREVACC